MLLWISLLQNYRSRKYYRETRDALRALDVDARADIGVAWLDISDVARGAALRATGQTRHRI